MKFAAIFLMAAFLISTAAFGAGDCSKPSADEATSGKKDFIRTLATKNEIQELFDRVRSDKRRWGGRAFRNQDGEFVVPLRGEEYPLPAVFINAIRSHIEQALDLGFADFVFYPDLGHGHLLLPEEEIRTALQSDSKTEFIEKVLTSPKLLILYHTAELFKMREGTNLLGPLVPDPWLKRRYILRNFTGDLKGSHLQLHLEKWPAYNTVREIPGYRQVRGFSISASDRGCFSYRQGSQEKFFDFAWE